MHYIFDSYNVFSVLRALPTRLHRSTTLTFKDLIDIDKSLSSILNQSSSFSSINSSQMDRQVENIIYIIMYIIWNRRSFTVASVIFIYLIQDGRNRRLPALSYT